MSTMRLKNKDGTWDKVPVLGSYQAVLAANEAATNAQNAANTAEKIATDLGLVDEAVQTAVSSAEQASNSATTASNKADVATAKADIATTKASEASTSATTATQKADAASTSAANADAVATQLTEYLATKETLTAPAVDKTLLIEGAAADSKVVGWNLSQKTDDFMSYDVVKGCDNIQPPADAFSVNWSTGATTGNGLTAKFTREKDGFVHFNLVKNETTTAVQNQFAINTSYKNKIPYYEDSRIHFVISSTNRNLALMVSVKRYDKQGNAIDGTIDNWISRNSSVVLPADTGYFVIWDMYLGEYSGGVEDYTEDNGVVTFGVHKYGTVGWETKLGGTIDFHIEYYGQQTYLSNNLKDSVHLITSNSDNALNISKEAYDYAKKVSDDRAYKNEHYRPQYHITSEFGWLNDPNGFCYDAVNKTYHMYYQYDPLRLYSARCVWGHCTSKDLIHWKDETIAINPSSTNKAAWSGSCIQDPDRYLQNAGVLQNCYRPIVAYYTSYDMVENTQVINLAYSIDGGYTFEEYSNNPILPESVPSSGNAFRDPKVVYDEANNQWIMVVTVGWAIKFYTSKDMVNWTFASQYDRPSTYSVPFECPNFVKIDGTWVLIVSVGGSDYNCEMYIVGTWNGTTFTANGELTRLDFGYDSYAAMTLTDAPDGNVYSISWAGRWNYNANFGDVLAESGYNGILTSVKKLKLVNGHIYCEPVLGEKINTFEYKNFNILDYEKLCVGNTYCMHLDIDTNATTADRFEIIANKQGNTYVKVIVDMVNNTVSFDRTNTINANLFKTELLSTCNIGEKITSIKVLVDRCVCELFVNNGKHIMTNLMFGNKNEADNMLMCYNGVLTLKYINISTVISSIVGKGGLRSNVQTYRTDVTKSVNGIEFYSNSINDKMIAFDAILTGKNIEYSLDFCKKNTCDFGVYIGNGTGYSSTVFMFTENKLAIYKIIGSTTEVIAEHAYVTDVNTWYNVSLVCQKNNTKIYVDDSLIASLAFGIINNGKCGIIMNGQEALVQVQNVNVR